MGYLSTACLPVKAAADRVAPPPEQGGLLALLSRLCPEYFGS